MWIKFKLSRNNDLSEQKKPSDAEEILSDPTTKEAHPEHWGEGVGGKVL